LTQFLIVKNLRLQKRHSFFLLRKIRVAKIYSEAVLCLSFLPSVCHCETTGRLPVRVNTQICINTIPLSLAARPSPFGGKKYQQRNKLAPQIIASTAHCGSKICGCAVKSATRREARKQLKLINRRATKVCVANIKKGDAVRRELNIYCLGTICSPLPKRFHSISLQCGIRPQKCL
jgi:hypothetical protein